MLASGGEIVSLRLQKTNSIIATSMPDIYYLLMTVAANKRPILVFSKILMAFELARENVQKIAKRVGVCNYELPVSTRNRC
jgi:hypothetical protein